MTKSIVAFRKFTNPLKYPYKTKHICITPLFLI